MANFEFSARVEETVKELIRTMPKLHEYGVNWMQNPNLPNILAHEAEVEEEE